MIAVKQQAVKFRAGNNSFIGWSICDERQVPILLARAQLAMQFQAQTCSLLLWKRFPIVNSVWNKNMCLSSQNQVEGFRALVKVLDKIPFLEHLVTDYFTAFSEQKLPFTGFQFIKIPDREQLFWYFADNIPGSISGRNT